MSVFASHRRQGLLTKHKIVTLLEEAVRYALTVGAEAAAVTVSGQPNQPTAMKTCYNWAGENWEPEVGKLVLARCCTQALRPKKITSIAAALGREFPKQAKRAAGGRPF